MSVPVIVLAVLTAVGGLIQVPSGWHLLDDWLEPVRAACNPSLEPTVTGEVLVGVISVTLALIAIALAWWLFVADPGRRARLAGALPRTRELLADQYRFDEVYEEAVVQPGRDLGDALARRRRGARRARAASWPWPRGADRRRPRPAGPPRPGWCAPTPSRWSLGAAIVGVIFVLAMR